VIKLAIIVYVFGVILMIGAILLQEGKGGGLAALGATPAASAFGASNPLRRLTVVLAVLFFLLAGFLSYVGSRSAQKAPVSEPGATAPAAVSPRAEAQPTGGPAGAPATKGAATKAPAAKAPSGKAATGKAVTGKAPSGKAATARAPATKAAPGPAAPAAPTKK
jgi:protein translocase SecG subunit